MKSTLFFFFLLILATYQPLQATPQDDSGDLETQEGPELRFRESTQRILNDHKLKRLARQDPVKAIVALDRLRAEGAEPPEEIAIAIAEVAIRGGDQEIEEAGVGLFLCAASETLEASLEQASIRGPTEISENGPLSALGLQVRAVEGLIDALESSGSAALAGSTVRFNGPLGEYRLGFENLADDWAPATHRYIRVSTIERKKKDFEGFRSGLGAPVVAVRKGNLPDEPDFEGSIFPIYKFYYPLTAVLEMGPAEPDAPRTAIVRLVDPRQEETFKLGGIDYPLAIDIGAQMLLLRQATDTTYAMSGIRQAGKHLDLMGLYFSEPPRPDKIPVVLVHGLGSSPRTWDEAYDDLVLDPELRQAYQFWLFAYPTGLPYPYSAMFLRDSLLEAIERVDPEGTNPLLRQTVLVGHSMGGLLIRMQVSDSGTVLWDAVFSESPDEIDLEPDDLAMMQEILIFESQPFVKRAIFFSVPHRGSEQAANSIGKIGASFVLLPDPLRGLGERILLTARDVLVGDAATRGKMPDSVQTLQPESVLIQALDELEIDPGITYHSIVGDKGQGDTPESSDGVVPYWSSHLDGATSEKIVPSGHGSHKDPEGVGELARILHEHLDSVRSGE